MRSSRLKKRGKMIVSMTKSTTQRSKSRSLSKSKKQQVGSQYRVVKSKSRSVPKQRRHEMAAFGANPRMETIDEPAARIFNQKDNRT